jgi:site-specific DNA-methyltransferase (cytosine-N4-specific)
VPTAVFHRADALRLPLPDKSVDLTIGSPPYLWRRTYGIDAVYSLDEWVAFMVNVTRESLRVCRGLVVWVANGATDDGVYAPACESLIVELHRQGLNVLRPAVWHKVDDNGGGTGIPGSGGKQWLRNDWEYCVAVKPPGPLPHANPTIHGHPPKCPPGGKIRNRNVDGSRGPRAFTQPKLINPGDVIKARVGGGHMGDKECHESEAPFPEKLAAWWIEAYCPPGGRVMDPFSGSGTTVCEAVRLGRHGIGFDIRYCQVLLGRQRLARRRAEGRA